MIRKVKQKSKDTLVDPTSVTVLSQVEHEDTDHGSSHNTCADLSLPQPSSRKELQDLDEKWSIRMARLEALLTLGQRPTPQPSFSPVKEPVVHQPLAGALSHKPPSYCLLFLLAKPVWLLAHIEHRLLPRWTCLHQQKTCTQKLTRNQCLLSPVLLLLLNPLLARFQSQPGCHSTGPD